MIPDRPDRVPDSIEPLIGYRAWYFTSDRCGASLLPIAQRSAAMASAWNGAGRRWVSATCPIQPPYMASDTVSRCLANIYAKLAVRGDLSPPLPLHSAPFEGCWCGFYAMKELASIQEPDGLDVVLGKVAFAGKVIEHEDGYRAERARILELIPVRATGRSIKRLALRLGIPLGPTLPWMHGLPPAA